MRYIADIGGAFKLLLAPAIQTSTTSPVKAAILMATTNCDASAVATFTVPIGAWLQQLLGVHLCELTLALASFNTKLRRLAAGIRRVTNVTIASSFRVGSHSRTLSDRQANPKIGRQSHQQDRQAS